VWGRRGTGTGRGVGGQPVGVRVYPDDDERAAALLTPEPRQRRVHRAALAAGAGRGLHAASSPKGADPGCRLRRIGRTSCVARSLLPASRRRREEVGIAVEMECPLRHAVAGETRRDETGTLYWADSWALFVGISGLCSRDFF
jgi:hypothetical protein